LINDVLNIILPTSITITIYLIANLTNLRSVHELLIRNIFINFLGDWKCLKGTDKFINFNWQRIIVIWWWYSIYLTPHRPLIMFSLSNVSGLRMEMSASNQNYWISPQINLGKSNPQKQIIFRFYRWAWSVLPSIDRISAF